MKTRHVLLAGLLICILFYAFTADATAIKGTVARYHPGHSITVLGADNRSLIFTLAPGVEVSGDIQEGRVVYLIPESDSPSAQIVKISLNDETPPGISNAYISGVVAPGLLPAASAAAGAAGVAGPGPGNANGTGDANASAQAPANQNGVTVVSPGNTTTQVSTGPTGGTLSTGVPVTLPPSLPPSAPSTAPAGKAVQTVGTVTGVVQSYAPGESLTIRRRDGTVTTYSLTASSRLPSGLAVGQRVEVVPGTSRGSVARQVTLARMRRSPVAISNQ